MVDPQKPDPDVFWCLKCRAHTDYTETKVWVSTEHGGYNKRILKCKTCDSRGNIPKQALESMRNTTKHLFWVGIGFIALAVGVFEAIAVGFGIYEGFNTDVIIVIYSSPFVCLLLWFFAQRRNVIIWLKWLSWAKKRGWEEVKPKGK